MVPTWRQRFRQFIGVPGSTHQAGEQVVAALGGLFGVLLVLAATRALVGPGAAVFIVPSLGASAVLVFAVPHSAFAQPWAVLGGNGLSALVGVACQQLIPNPTLAAAAAVGLAIGIMHLARCIHPPGGATALAAVIGGAAIHDLGFAYAWSPVAINCLILLAAGLGYNLCFPWRRYPASLMRYASAGRAPAAAPWIGEEHVNAALERLNVVVDVSPGELAEIIRQTLASARRSAEARLPEVCLGHYYCNDKPGQQWSVRQIVDERRAANPDHDLVIYKVVDGNGLHRTGSCTRGEFAAWVGSELQPRNPTRP